jgi:hypothetical protein
VGALAVVSISVVCEECGGRPSLTCAHDLAQHIGHAVVLTEGGEALGDEGRTWKDTRDPVQGIARMQDGTVKDDAMVKAKRVWEA